MLSPGYLQSEACALADLCIQLNGDGVNEVIPPYTGPWEEAVKETVIPDPFDNAWALWRKQDAGANVYAIVIRATIPKDVSILEDILADSVAANGALDLGGGKFLPLQLAGKDVAGAAVHSGFVWGMAVLLFHQELGILGHLEPMAAGDIFITGHSQGAAIATLMHSFFVYAAAASDPKYAWLKGRSFKSYVFAQPKPGNWQYAMDLARLAGNAGAPHTINNALDWVPQVPFALQGLTDIADSPIKPFLEKNLPLLSSVISSAEAVVSSLKAHLSGVTNAIPEWRAHLNKHIDAKYTVGAAPPASGAGGLNYVPCGVVRSTAMRPDLSGIVPNWPNDPLAQHHLLVYKNLLGCP